MLIDGNCNINTQYDMSSYSTTNLATTTTDGDDGQTISFNSVANVVSMDRQSFNSVANVAMDRHRSAQWRIL